MCVSSEKFSFVSKSYSANDPLDTFDIIYEILLIINFKKEESQIYVYVHEVKERACKNKNNRD